MVTQSPVNLDHFLQKRMQEGNISSTTLVFTLFCDVVTQHGGEIWLGSVIYALAPLGINERLTRTAVFRLVKEGWLKSRKQGRRSYYRLTQTGINYYQRAAKRIYANNKPEWDGIWTLLFVALVPDEKRDALHRGLSWLGYGRMAAGVYALPFSNHPPLEELLMDLDLEDSIVHMQATTENAESLQKLVMARWKLRNLRQRYKDFSSHYEPVRQAIQSKTTSTDHSLFLLRVLLIHEYRRVLLSDPELPAAMLPAHWEGHVAQALTRDIYRTLAARTGKWVNRELRNAEGYMKGAADILETRFPNEQAMDAQP